VPRLNLIRYEKGRVEDANQAIDKIDLIQAKLFDFQSQKFDYHVKVKYQVAEKQDLSAYRSALYVLLCLTLILKRIRCKDAYVSDDQGQVKKLVHLIAD
jgi:hypothetical protein